MFCIKRRRFILRIILLGAPGSGKGTQAKLICESLRIPHISTGDIFRDNISRKTILGKQVKDYLDKGKLVPDELTIAVVKSRLDEDDCINGFLLDGFPRNINQARNLGAMLEMDKQQIDAVFLMEATQQLILERLSGRRYCSKCGSVYNIKSNPSKIIGKCDNCGESLIQRNDDKEEVILERMVVYNTTIKPMIEYYSSLGVLYNIQVNNEINEVFSNITNTLKAV